MGKTIRRDMLGEKNWRWTGADASYAAVHLRLRRIRGGADCYDCVGCGKPAREWAYDGRDAEARTDSKAGRGPEPLRYSVKPFHYIPLCHRCHLDLDGNSVGVHKMAKTHCPQGHPYSAANTYTSEGHRRCRTCVLDRVRRRRTT